MDELLARVRAALRRVRYTRNRSEEDKSTFVNGVLSLDYAAGSVTVAGTDIHLAPMEYKLLCLLARNVGKVLTYKYILKTVWGSSLDQNLPSLRVFMATLRKKLEKASGQCCYIKTHVGVGYRMLRVEAHEEHGECFHQEEKNVPPPLSCLTKGAKENQTGKEGR